MAEISFGWASNGTGDGAAISVVDSAELLKAIVGGSGVIRGYLNELAPTVSGSNVLVNTGWGVGATGHLYRNSASKSTTITTPSTGTTGHRIVLREDLAAQTVRIYDIASADGTASIPAAAATDVMIATLTITTGGVITLADVRAFASTFSPAYMEMLQLGGGSLRAPAGLTATGRVLLAAFKASAVTNTTDGSTNPVALLNAFGLTAYSNGSAGWFTSLTGGVLSLNTNSIRTVGIGTLEVLSTSSTPSNNTCVAPDRSPWMRVRFNPTATGNANMNTKVVGFSSDNASATPNGAFVRRNTTGNLYFVTRQGGSETATDMGAQSNAQRWYDIWTPDAGVTWYCVDHTAGVLYTHTTNVPTVATDLMAVAYANMSGAVTGQHAISSMYVSCVDE